MYPTVYTDAKGSGNGSRELRIPAALGDLERTTERLMKISEEFYMRLEKTCTPIPPVNEMAQIKDTPPMPQSEISQIIEGQTARIRRVCEKLETLMSRLEL